MHLRLCFHRSRYLHCRRLLARDRKREEGVEAAEVVAALRILPQSTLATHRFRTSASLHCRIRFGTDDSRFHPLRCRSHYLHCRRFPVAVRREAEEAAEEAGKRMHCTTAKDQHGNFGCRDFRTHFGTAGSRFRPSNRRSRCPCHRSLPLAAVLPYTQAICRDRKAAYRFRTLSRRP